MTYSPGCGVENAMLPENAVIIIAKPMSIVYFLPIFVDRILARGNATIAATCDRISGKIVSFCCKPRIYSAYLIKFYDRALYVI